MPRQEWLTYYAREFNACEVNSTYYALPKPSNVKAMVDRTGEGFLFSIKANQEMTHRREDASVLELSCQVLEPVISAGKLDSAAEKTFIFANNHWRGRAVSAIRQPRIMLD
jgi:uncharacterized protein YecE (DUF72 family)